MNRNRKTFGFYFAFLVALFQITGISAMEKTWNSHVDKASDSAEITSSEGHQLWASEEIILQVKLPEYSESHFYGTATPYAELIRLCERQQEEMISFNPHRDLRSLLTSLIYPFHFFH